MRLLIKDLLLKDKKQLIKERNEHLKLRREYNNKSSEYTQESHRKLMLLDYYGAKKALDESHEFIRKGADERDILTIYDKAIRRKEIYLKE